METPISARVVAGPAQSLQALFGGGGDIGVNVMQEGHNGDCILGQNSHDLHRGGRAQSGDFLEAQKLGHHDGDQLHDRTDLSSLHRRLPCRQLQRA